MKHIQLFLAFFRVGMLGYGGGPASIPLVHKEVVDKYKWMNDDEFADVLALGNTLPGPIATKMAGYIGYRVAGVLGMINAVLATIVPTIVLMIILLTFLATYKDLPWVSGMSKAVVPIVGVMLASLTWDFFKKSKDTLGWMYALIIVVASIVLIELLNVHPALLIGSLLAYALLKKDKAPDVQQPVERGVGL
ncbi:chromate transporter [Bacillus mesophilus]|uniref:Chromate transporter n=1 Tax=Bacillus mesophilus TaxID=1808955 RepID=A0A6M0QAA1_9BACI|nr:chromate transporter [Bacillus mesophilus]MBM7661982.1 chromate transporter [Bacillus mesophilus]NEY72659.1 chromate transporter [Bacillus mesophilus]